MLALRGLTRRLGINALLGKALGGQGYEAKLSQTMLASVRPGDRVWDVGANIGHYTLQFAKLVGPHGRVYAFEPSSINRARLEGGVAGLPSVRILAMGLSNTSGQGLLLQGFDDLGATSRIVRNNAKEEAAVEHVPLVAGDDLVASGEVDSPTFIKIDVEGFEPEVMQGLSRTLANGVVREVIIEMHFSLLAARGLAGAARDIEDRLRADGFKLSWLDASHLHAHRNG